MAVFNNWPWAKYANDLNLSWILKETKYAVDKVNEFQVFIDDNLEKYIEQYVLENLDKFILTASYIEADKTIVLQMEANNENS